MFVTTIKFEDDDDARKPANHFIVIGNPKDYNDDQENQAIPNNTTWEFEQPTLVGLGILVPLANNHYS